MARGWTGGQYSVYRLLFGAYLCCEFLSPFWEGVWERAGSGFLGRLLTPIAPGLVDRPAVLATFLVAGAVCALFFCAGKWDRIAAWLMFLLLPIQWGDMITPGLGIPNILLVLHMFLPRAPYGSVAALGRLDPGGGWRMPIIPWRVAWLLLIAVYLSNGLVYAWQWSQGGLVLQMRLDWFAWLLARLPPPAFPLFAGTVVVAYLSFTPAVLIPHLRFPAWTVLFIAQLLLLLTGTPLGGWPLVFLHLFAFSPAWLPPRETTEKTFVFYDGQCGLCHRAMRFLLAEDPEGRLFRLAPLGGEAFLNHTEPDARQGLPDSIVYRNEAGALQTKSTAALSIAGRLGGYWRLLARLACWVPRPIRDLFYDFIARIRYRLFKKPEDVCPVLPKHLRDRFEL